MTILGPKEILELAQLLQAQPLLGQVWVDKLQLRLRKLSASLLVEPLKLKTCQNIGFLKEKSGKITVFSRRVQQK